YNNHNNSNNLQIPTPMDNLFYTPTPPSPTNSTQTTNPHSTTPTTSNPHNPSPIPTSSALPTTTINIATHNIQGYNNTEKKLLLEKFCLTHNLHIISLTETKIAETPKKKFFNSKFFTYYWANSTTAKEGTCIMIKNHLQPHVHKILNHPGGAIAIDLFLKQDFKFRIISVYLSSTNSNTRKETQQTVISWIRYALQHQLRIIILGDFNSQDTPTTFISTSIKFQLANYLHSINMYD